MIQSDQIHGIALDEILKVIDDVLDLSQPCKDVLDQSITTFGVDSIEIMQLNLDLEKAFKLSIDFDVFTSETTFNELIHQLKPFEG